MQLLTDKKNNIHIKYFAGGTGANNGYMLVLPGGPGILSDYLDNLCSDISSKFKIAVVLIDYPNHRIVNRGMALSYSQIEDNIIAFITQFNLKNKASLRYLMTHSYGCHFSIKILQKFDSIVKAHLISYPKSKRISKRLQFFLKKNESNINNEKEFRKYWRKMLKVYFKGRRFNLNKLVRKTSWLVNYSSANGRKYALDSIRNIQKFKSKIIFHDGRFDPLYVIGDYQLLKLKVKAQYLLYKNSSHFPMLEERNTFIRSLSLDVTE